MLLLTCLLLSSNLKAQAVSQGNILLDAYYGAPNFGKSVLKNFEGDQVKTSGIKGLGPMGIRAEYMLADRFGLGIDAIYNSTGMNFSYDSLNNDGSLYRTYHGTGTMNRIRIHLRFNYHFVSTDKLDVYTGVGAGSNTRIWAFKSNDPDFNEDRVSTTGTLLPVSMRLAIGTRYYFTENIGLNAEIGIGGPLVSAGVSFKF